MLTSLVMAVAALAGVQAQSSSVSGYYSTYTLQQIFPGGPQTRGSSLESTIPIQCDEVCLLAGGPYYFCYINRQLPGGGTQNATICDVDLCTQDYFNLLSSCLNCIVVNGNERPFGYATNTSLTAYPTYASGTPAGILYNPNGFINQDVAGRMLQNVTNHCSSLSSSLTGATTVASPTTTGPYYTTWTAGADVSLTVWTPLTTYTSILAEVTATTLLASTFKTGSPPVQSSSTSGAAAASNTASGASAAASTSRSAGLVRVNVPFWARIGNWVINELL